MKAQPNQRKLYHETNAGPNAHTTILKKGATTQYALSKGSQEVLR